MSDSVSMRLRRLVIQRAHGICEYCLIHQADACFSFHIDHVISRKQHGLTLSENLALSCLRCNVAKGTDPGTFIGAAEESVQRFRDVRDLIRRRIVPLVAGHLLVP